MPRPGRKLGVRVVLLLLYLAAGLFVPALPWAPLASALTSTIGVWRGARTDDFLSRWWEVSKPRAIAMLAGRLVLSIGLDTAAMLIGNWLTGNWLRGMF